MAVSLCLCPNLDSDDSVYMDPLKKKISTRIKGALILLEDYAPNYFSTSFTDFVDRVLALQGNSSVYKFSLKMEDGDDLVDPIHVIGWILNVLQRGGVSDLNVSIDLELEPLFPSKIFSTKTLVSLKLSGAKIDVGNVYLPKLKTPYIGSVRFEKDGIEFTKLLSDYHILEDLVLDGMCWSIWDFASVSVTTLKRLTVWWGDRVWNPMNVSLDTPNLVYLEFTDTIAHEYPKVNLDSLVEAKIDLRMTSDEIIWTRLIIEEASFSECSEEYGMIGNATDFMLGMCNVKTLYLSSDTLEVLTVVKQYRYSLT